MGRRCSVLGCHRSVGLHYIPQNLELRRQWLRAIGLEEDSKLSPQASVCKDHFTRDSFANLREVELGYARCLRLRSDAIPTLVLPRIGERKPILLPRQPEVSLRQSETEAKPTREIGCQTDPEIKDNTTPCRGTKVQPSVQSVSCETDASMEMQFPQSSRRRYPPMKRKRCESSAFNRSCHPDNSASSNNSTSTDVPPHKDKKYIVHQAQLLGLFHWCPVCSNRCTVDTSTDGTLLLVTQQCARCNFYYQWSSQPMVNNIPAGDLQLCAAVLFTGSSFRQISKFLGAFNVQGLSEQCFYEHQAEYLIPTVSWQWKVEQDKLIKEAVDGGAVTVGGDMLADSSGHSAKYGSYTMMNLQTNKVIDIQLVQSNEVGGSVHMKKEGLVRSLNNLEGRGVKVQAIVTDHHAGVQTFLREDKKDIIHYFDPWHIGKGLQKKIDELGKIKETEEVLLWRKSVVNHLYWAASTSSSGEEAVIKWTSVVNHIQNVYTQSNSIHPQCEQEPLTEEDTRVWPTPNTSACERLNAILLASEFLKDVEKISPQFHISIIKDFHSIIKKFSSKSVGYSFKEILSRLQIAALHYNENATRCRAATATGELKYTIVSPKCKRGKHTVKAQKTKPTSSYIDKLMTLLFDCVVQNPVSYQAYADKVPVPEPPVNA